MTKIVITNSDPTKTYRLRIIKTDNSSVNIGQQLGAVIETNTTVNICLAKRPRPKLMWSINSDKPLWNKDNTVNIWPMYPMWPFTQSMWGNENDAMWAGDHNAALWVTRAMWSNNATELMWN